MNDKKILFFDIDGTLLIEEENRIPESTIEAIKLAKKKGHKIIINTGRPKVAIEQNIIDLQPDGYICGCGTYIETDGNVLFHNTLDNVRCLEIVSIVNKYKHKVLYEGRFALYFGEDKSHPLLEMCYDKFTKLNMPIYKDNHQDIIFDKFVILHNVGEDLSGIKAELNEFEFIDRAPDFKEIVPKGFTKATGIEFLINHFHSHLDNCYVFGDSNNDRPMLDYVKYSVVMGNASDNLKATAYFVTKDIEEDGIMYALEQLSLL